MADNWKKKYDDLLVNFKDLDRYNDVLYLCFHLAKRVRDSGQITDEFLKAIANVEKFEDSLYTRREND